VDQLVDRGIVKSMADLYDLRAEDLASLERMGAKSAANIVRNIEKLEEEIHCRACWQRGYPLRGERTAVFLAEAFGSLDRIASAGLEELQQAEEVGPKVP